MSMKNKFVWATDDEARAYRAKAETFDYTMFSSMQSGARCAIMEFLAQQDGKTLYKSMSTSADE